MKTYGAIVILGALLSMNAWAATKPTKSVAQRFKITSDLKLDADKLPFLNDEKRLSVTAAKAVYENMLKIETGEWTAGTTDICFELAGSTVEINMCADSQLGYVEGKLLSLYSKTKNALEANEDLKGSDEMVRAKKYLTNAGRALGGVAGQLCQSGTMSWWGGTGRSAAIMGCHSKFLKDSSDLDIVLAIAKAKPVELTDDNMYDITNDILVARLKKSYIDATNEPGFYDDPNGGKMTYEEKMLLEADAKYNKTYVSLRDEYYTEKHFPINDWDSTYDVDGDGVNDPVYKIGKHNLRETARAWLKYRDAACQAYSVFLFPYDKEHEAYGAAARVSCLRKLTEKFTKEMVALKTEY